MMILKETIFKDGLEPTVSNTCVTKIMLILFVHYDEVYTSKLNIFCDFFLMTLLNTVTMKVLCRCHYYVNVNFYATVGMSIQTGVEISFYWP